MQTCDGHEDLFMLTTGDLSGYTGELAAAAKKSAP